MTTSSKYLQGHSCRCRVAGGCCRLKEWHGWITADQAVELRESKGKATFLLIDAHSAGAGMDGIYSAAREIDEKTLFKEAISILQKSTERSWRDFAEDAMKRARRLGGRRNSTSMRQEFEFFGLVHQQPKEGGRMIHLLGLWPVVGDTAAESRNLLGQSALIVEKLLMPPATSQAPAVRIGGLVLSQHSEDQIALEHVLRNSGSQPRARILETVAKSSQLWLGNLRPAFLDSSLAKIDIISWRRPNDRALGLVRFATVARRESAPSHNRPGESQNQTGDSVEDRAGDLAEGFSKL